MTIFDFDDGDIIFNTYNGVGIDMNGDIMLKVGNNMAMDIDTGDLHITSDWDKDED